MALADKAWAQSTGPFGLSQHIASSLTHSATTTAYAAGEGWCTTTTSCTGVFSWAVCSASGSGRFLITGVHTFQNGPTTTPTTYLRMTGILWLYTASPSAVFGDYVSFAFTNTTDQANLLFQAGISFSEANATGVTTTTFSGSDIPGTWGPFQCGSSTSTVYGQVEVTNAYIPISGEKFTATLDIVFLQ